MKGGNYGNRGQGPYGGKQQRMGTHSYNGVAYIGPCILPDTTAKYEMLGNEYCVSGELVMTAAVIM